MIPTAGTRISGKSALSFAVGMLAGLWAWGGTNEARGNDWMFRRSYYSHAVPPDETVDYPLPQSRTAYRPAVVGGTPGIALRGAVRYNTLFLRSGNSVDVTIHRELWWEVNP